MIKSAYSSLLLLCTTLFLAYAPYTTANDQEEVMDKLEYEIQNRMFSFIAMNGAVQKRKGEEDAKFWEAYYALELLNQNVFPPVVAKYGLEMKATRWTEFKAWISGVYTGVFTEAAMKAAMKATNKYMAKLHALEQEATGANMKIQVLLLTIAQLIMAGGERSIYSTEGHSATSSVSSAGQETLTDTDDIVFINSVGSDGSMSMTDGSDGCEVGEAQFLRNKVDELSRINLNFLIDKETSYRANINYEEKRNFDDLNIYFKLGKEEANPIRRIEQIEKNSRIDIELHYSGSMNLKNDLKKEDLRGMLSTHCEFKRQELENESDSDYQKIQNKERNVRNHLSEQINKRHEKERNRLNNEYEKGKGSIIRSRNESNKLFYILKKEAELYLKCEMEYENKVHDAENNFMQEIESSSRFIIENEEHKAWIAFCSQAETEVNGRPFHVISLSNTVDSHKSELEDLRDELDLEKVETKRLEEVIWQNSKAMQQSKIAINECMEIIVYLKEQVYNLTPKLPHDLILQSLFSGSIIIADKGTQFPIIKEDFAAKMDVGCDFSSISCPLENDDYSTKLYKDYYSVLLGDSYLWHALADTGNIKVGIDGALRIDSADCDIDIIEETDPVAGCLSVEERLNGDKREECKLESIKNSIETINKNIETAVSNINKLQTLTASKSTAIEDIEKDNKNNSIKIGDCVGRASLLEEKNANNAKKIKQLEQEIGRIEKGIEGLDIEEKAVRVSIDACVQKEIKANELIENMNKEISKIQAEVNEQDKDAHIRMNGRIESLNAEIKAERSIIQHNCEKKVVHEQEIIKLEEEKSKKNNKILNDKNEIQLSRDANDKNIIDIRSFSNNIENRKNIVKTQEDKAKELREELENTRQLLSKHESHKKTFEGKVEELNEELGVKIKK